MSDLTIEDLIDEETTGAAAEAGKQAAEQASEKGTGEWFLELYEKMQEDNVLMPILFGEDALPADAQPAQPEVDPEDTEMFGNNDETDDTEAEAEEINEINAESIAGICEGIENTLGDVRISQIRTMCESNPEQVNQMIDQHL